jgi:hypothetical protein
VSRRLTALVPAVVCAALGPLLIPQVAYPATTTVAADTFQRTLPSGWGNAGTGGWWTIVGSPWSWSVAPGAGSVAVAAGGQEQAYLSTFTTQDVEVVQKVVLPRCTGAGSTCGAFVVGRHGLGFNPAYYRVGVVQGADRPTIFLRAQRSDGTSIGGDVDTGVPAADDATVWLRVQFQGVNPTAVRARAWADGATEPASWQLDTTDSTAAQQAAGAIGVQFRNEEAGAGRTFKVASYEATGTAAPVSVIANPSPSTAAHWLYDVVDGTIYVHDIDNNHTLVKQFDIPVKGKRGVIAAPSRGMLYVSSCGTGACGGTRGYLLAYDLVHDVVAWIANYKFGTDHPAITPNGSTIYMPHGGDASDVANTVIDASNGKPTGSITTGTNGHNTVASLDGAQVYSGGYSGPTKNYVSVVDPSTNQVVLQAGPTINGVRPFTVNGSRTLLFTTSTNFCGFQVLSLASGNVLHTVPFGGSCMFAASDAPSHGISLSPDEKRVYIIDAALNALMVYDISGLPASPPTFVAQIPLSSLAGFQSPCQTHCQREGWVLNDLSGRYVYVGDSGDVVSTATNSVVTTLQSLRNTRQMIEVDWANGTTSATSTHFGLGYNTTAAPPPPPPPSPMPGETIARDTFQRPDQGHWGTASDGALWGGEANTSNAFSIVGGAGRISNANGIYNAVLGASTADTEVLFSGSMSSYSNSNLGSVLRWKNTNNWYKGYINGSSLVVQKKVDGATTIIGSAPFTATPGTSYSLRFRIVGNTLYARVWPAGSTEPTSWMVTVSDSTFSTGLSGMRVQVATGVTATVGSYLATVPDGSASPPPPPPPPPTGAVLAQDTFQRPNQPRWGTASDGQTWSGDANTVSAFSIAGNAGQVANTGGASYSAILGPAASDAEVLFSGSMTSYNNSNVGSVLRWTSGNSWYKAYLAGTSLIVQKKVAGVTTNLKSMPFAASPGTSYTLRFRAVGTTLYAKAWPSADMEPADWMITVSDLSLASGYCGLRMLAQSGSTARYTSFQATPQ